MPTTQAAMRAMVSQEYLDMIDNSSAHSMPTGAYLDNIKTNCYAANGIAGEPAIAGSGSADLWDWFNNIWLLFWSDWLFIHDLANW